MFFLLNIAEHENFLANKYEMPTIDGIFMYFMLSWVKHNEQSFITSGPANI